MWLAACWYFATDKDGVSALALQRRLGIVSYQTAWAMLARLRSVVDDRDKELLSGDVEADETFLGGHTPGQRGGRQHGAKILVGVAVERERNRNGFGRSRLSVLEDASWQSLRSFLRARVAEGSRVITDGWGSYAKATAGLYEHSSHVAPGATAAVYLPAAHRVASLLKRWLLSTHQGSFGWDHVGLYLAEFEFRFNRRRSLLMDAGGGTTRVFGRVQLIYQVKHVYLGDLHHLRGHLGDPAAAHQPGDLGASH